MRTERRPLIGNRLALAGAIIYLLEWVGIIDFNPGNVPAAQGAKPAEIVAQYTQVRWRHERERLAFWKGCL